MITPDYRPEIRPVEPVPIEHEGSRLIYLRDPHRFCENELTVSTAAYRVIRLMDGTRTIDEIRGEFEKMFEIKLPQKELESLIRALDDSRLLNNENFCRFREEKINEFLRSPVRPAALAGRSYPADGSALSEMLDKYLDGARGPQSAPFAVVAPHIDLAVGGPSFGMAYSRLRNSQAQTFVILAIGHTLAEDFFACTDKGFETPLGTMETDTAFLSELEKQFGEPIYENAFAHKNEHSAELQVLFLQKIFSSANPPKKIVPILFSFPVSIESLDHPNFNARRVGRFIDALRKCVDSRKGSVCLVAGIDLSHVGARFGQPDRAGREKLERVEAEDRIALELLTRNDKKGFVEQMRMVEAQNNVCGFPALYVLMDLLDGHRGKLLDYRQNVEGNNDSMVSFAAMTFE